MRCSPMIVISIRRWGGGMVGEISMVSGVATQSATDT